MSEWVLDASALLAIVKNEEGSGRVRSALDAGAAISTVNLSEVVAVLTGNGVPANEIRFELGNLNVQIEDFIEDDAYTAGLLKPLTDANDLSFADRACIALARRLGLPVLTADQPWIGLPLGGNPEIVLIR